MHLVFAVPLALIAAITFAVSAVLQQRAARDVPEEASMTPRLFVDLLRRQAWLAGIGCLIAAYLLEATALAFGTVSLVEPLITLELACALPLAMRLRHRRAGTREWSGMALVIVGVATFLALAPGEAGDPNLAVTTWLALALPCAVVVGLLVVAARGPEAPRRAALLAVAAGVTNGLLALITKSMVTLLARGVVPVLTSWQPYALIVLGLLGLLFAQSAYQAAPLAISLPIIDAVEPVVAVLLATVGFKELLASSALALTGEMIGAAMALAGIFSLGRSPLVLSVYEQTERAKREKAAGAR